MVSLEHYLILGLPIKLDKGLGVINQPTIKELISNGFNVDSFLQPFLLRVDLIQDMKGLEDFKQSINDFDLLFLQDEKGNFIFKDGDIGLLLKLINCLHLIYKTEDVSLIYEKQTILIDNSIAINRNNYTYLADIILEIFDTEKPKPVDNTPKYKDKARQQLWEKLERRRAEEARKKALTLADIINITIHLDGYIGYNTISEMTYYQLLNTYKTLMNKMSYDEYLMFKSSGQFDLKQDTKHWTSNTKVKRSTIQA